MVSQVSSLGVCACQDPARRTQCMDVNNLDVNNVWTLIIWMLITLPVGWGVFEVLSSTE